MEGLLPDQALTHRPSSVFGRASEVVALQSQRARCKTPSRVSSPCRQRCKHRARTGETASSGHFVVHDLDGQLLRFRIAMIATLHSHVVRWICQPHVHQLAASEFCQVVDAGRITTQKAVLSITQTSPGTVTWFSCTAGASSGSVRPSVPCTGISAAISSSVNPTKSRSNPRSPSSPSSSDRQLVVPASIQAPACCRQ
jgi:hypothetical protein